MKIENDYNDSLNKSNSLDLIERLKMKMKDTIPNYFGIVSTGNEFNFQKHGMDFIILTSMPFFPNSKSRLISTEVKFRFPKVDSFGRTQIYNDFLFEKVSNTKTGAIGWAEKNEDYWCDLFVYYNTPIDKYYLFYWSELSKVWNHYKKEWEELYGTVTAHNIEENGYEYNSINVPVPEDVLLSKILFCITTPNTSAVDLVKKFYADKEAKEEIERMEFLKKNDPITYEYILKQKSND
jgi:hypothetical protein